MPMCRGDFKPWSKDELQDNEGGWRQGGRQTGARDWCEAFCIFNKGGPVLSPILTCIPFTVQVSFHFHEFCSSFAHHFHWPNCILIPLGLKRLHKMLEVVCLLSFI